MRKIETKNTIIFKDKIYRLVGHHIDDYTGSICHSCAFLIKNEGCLKNIEHKDLEDHKEFVRAELNSNNNETCDSLDSKNDKYTFFYKEEGDFKKIKTKKLSI